MMLSPLHIKKTIMYCTNRIQRRCSDTWSVFSLYALVGAHWRCSGLREHVLSHLIRSPSWQKANHGVKNCLQRQDWIEVQRWRRATDWAFFLNSTVSLIICPRPRLQGGQHAAVGGGGGSSVAWRRRLVRVEGHEGHQTQEAGARNCCQRCFHQVQREGCETVPCTPLRHVWWPAKEHQQFIFLSFNEMQWMFKTDVLRSACRVFDGAQLVGCFKRIGELATVPVWSEPASNLSQVPDLSMGWGTPWRP